MRTREMICRHKLIAVAVAACLISTPPAHCEDQDADPAADSSTWITSIAPHPSSGNEPGTFVAGTATSLLLREADVVSFSADAPQDLTTLYSHPAAVWCVASTADGKMIVSVDYRGNLMTFDTSTEQVETHDKAFERWCQSMVLSPDDQHVVAGNEDGKVMAWEIRSKSVVTSTELDGHAVTDLAFAPDGKRVAASDGDGHVHLLKWPSLEAIGMIKISDEPAWSVAFIDDGRSLLVGSGDRNLYRCPAKPESKAKVLVKGSDWISEVEISPGGQIAAGQIGGRVLFPPQQEGVTESESIEADSGIWAIQWNGDGQLLVGTRKHGIVVAGRSWKWTDTGTAEPVAETADE